MSLKMKLTATISAFCLVLGLMLMGVFAASQGTVNMGGSIGFTATDVYARVTGEITGAGVGNKELPELLFTAENDKPDQSGWSNLLLEFDSDATPIKIDIQVENLASDRKLIVNMIDNMAESIQNLKESITQDGAKYISGTNIGVQANTGAGDNVANFQVIFEVESADNSVPPTDFDFDINLFDSSVAPETPKEEIKDFVFIVNEEDKTATLTSYTGTATEVEIPSTIGGVEIEDATTFALNSKDATTALANESVQAFKEILSSAQQGGLMGSLTKEQVQLLYMFASSFSYTDINGDKQHSDALSGVAGIMSGDSSQMIAALEQLNYPTTIELEYTYTLENIDISDMSSRMTLYIYYFAQLSGWSDGIVKVTDGCVTPGDYSVMDLMMALVTGGVVNDKDYLEIELSPIGKTTSYKGEEYTVTNIGGAFYGCSSLTSIKIPEGVTSIGAAAFYGCSSLTSIEIPEGVTSIGEGAFQFCSSLTSITIPTSVTSIGFGVFVLCSHLTSVIFNTTYTWEVSSSSSFDTIEAELTPEQVQSNALDYLTSTYNGYYWRVKQ